MKRVEVPSYPVQIFIAGKNAALAETECRLYCDEVGLCVSVTLTEYVYTGGEDFGIIVGLINYPRFPSTPEQIWAHAEVLGERLRGELGQQSYTIQAPDKTVWFSHRPEDNPA
jgi:hypothetical protein